MLLLDIFQAFRSEETGIISAVHGIVVIQRKSISSRTKDAASLASLRLCVVCENSFLNCMSLKNIVSFFFFLKSISVTKETLSFLPLEQWEKKLCCLLGLHCPQRELSFISMPRNLRIHAFGRDCIWAKNFKLPCVIFDQPF